MPLPGVALLLWFRKPDVADGRRSDDSVINQRKQ
jgi:hypothetical protein